MVVSGAQGPTGHAHSSRDQRGRENLEPLPRAWYRPSRHQGTTQRRLPVECESADVGATFEPVQQHESRRHLRISRRCTERSQHGASTMRPTYRTSADRNRVDARCRQGRVAVGCPRSLPLLRAMVRQDTERLFGSANEVRNPLRDRWWQHSPRLISSLQKPEPICRRIRGRSLRRVRLLGC